MAAGDITFVECPYGDSFPVRKTEDRSSVNLEETVERLSPEPKIRMWKPVTRFA
jgi:hypothetical protein